MSFNAGICWCFYISMSAPESDLGLRAVFKFRGGRYTSRGVSFSFKSLFSTHSSTSETYSFNS